MKHLSNDHKHHPNHKNSHKLSNEIGHPMHYGIAYLVTHSTFVPLVVLIYPLIVLTCSLGALVYSFIVLKPWGWVRHNLILKMSDIIYINSNLKPLTKFTISRKSTEFKDTLPWNISHMITNTIPITRIVISYAMKQGIHLEFNGKSIETERKTWSESHNGGKAIPEQTLASEETNSKEQDCENHSHGSK